MHPRRPGHQAEAREGGALIMLSDGGDAATDATRSLRGAAGREEEVRSARCASRACGCTAKEHEHAMESRTSARGRMRRVGLGASDANAYRVLLAAGGKYVTYFVSERELRPSLFI